MALSINYLYISVRPFFCYVYSDIPALRRGRGGYLLPARRWVPIARVFPRYILHLHPKGGAPSLQPHLYIRPSPPPAPLYLVVAVVQPESTTSFACPLIECPSLCVTAHRARPSFFSP